MKKFFWTMAVLIPVAGVIAGFFIVTDILETLETKNEEIKDGTVHAEEAGETEETKERESTGEVYRNPFGDSKRHKHLMDRDYLEYIHLMAHQKVKADVKWGFFEITDERLDWLLEGLDERELEHEDVYRDILERWSKGDFSQADKDHNTVWEIQGGTVGKATGILSEAEEQAFIESQPEGRAN